MTNIDKHMYNWASDLFPITRSITGKGTVDVLKCIKKDLPTLKIKSVKSWRENFGLLRPYAIASKGTTYDVSNIIVEVSLENGLKGLGASAPTEIDEGETFKKCLPIL